MTKWPRFNLTSFNIYLWLSPTNPAYATITTKRQKSSLCLSPLVPSYYLAPTATDTYHYKQSRTEKEIQVKATSIYHI